MRKLEDLSVNELTDVLGRILWALYGTVELDEEGEEQLVLTRNVSRGSDTIEAIDQALTDAGLAPDESVDEEEEPQRFDYVRACVDGDFLSWDYRLKGGRDERLRHDEGVEGWSDRDVEKITRQMLLVDEGDPVKIEIIRS
jgi:hypothetical protein